MVLVLSWQISALEVPPIIVSISVDLSIHKRGGVEKILVGGLDVQHEGSFKLLICRSTFRKYK